MDDDEYLGSGEDALDAVDFGDEEDPDDGGDAEVAKPPTDHVVHIYHLGKLSRTIPRPFTAEDAEAFASEYNRTARPYGRFAVAGKEKGRVKKTIDWSPTEPRKK